jgi:hypothetical protein
MAFISLTPALSHGGDKKERLRERLKQLPEDKKEQLRKRLEQLTPEQKEQLKKLLLEGTPGVPEKPPIQEGSPTLKNPPVTRSLTPEQKEKLKNLSPEQRKKLLTQLTPEQKRQLIKLLEQDQGLTMAKTKKTQIKDKKGPQKTKRTRTKGDDPFDEAQDRLDELLKILLEEENPTDRRKDPDTKDRDKPSIEFKIHVPLGSHNGNFQENPPINPL